MEVEQAADMPAIITVEDFIRPYVKEMRLAGAQPTPDIDCGDEGDDGVDDERDPYEVTLAEFRRVSHEEYSHALVEPLDRSITLHFNEFVHTARHIFGSSGTAEEHDPMVLIRATALACNMKGVARLAASYVPHSELQTVENGDTTKVLNYLKSRPEAKQKIDQILGELLYALMTVDVATRPALWPPHIARVLNNNHCNSTGVH